MPPPFLGTAVVGGGGLTAAIDAYGDVVDLRAPGPAGPALVENPAERQGAGTVAADTGIVPRVSFGGGGAAALARRLGQAALPAGDQRLVTEARFGAARVEVVWAASGGRLACLTRERAADLDRGRGTRGRRQASLRRPRRLGA